MVLTETQWAAMGDVQDYCWVEGISYSSCKIMTGKRLLVQLSKMY